MSRSIQLLTSVLLVVLLLGFVPMWLHHSGVGYPINGRLTTRLLVLFVLLAFGTGEIR